MKTCKNCKTRYTNKFHYCPKCGAQWVEYRLTPRKITAEFTDRYLGTDNVFLKTCITLFRHPEDVINGYISGQRKKYVNVISFFFISLTLFGLHIFILQNFYPELLGLDVIEKENKNIAAYFSKFYDYMGLLTTVFVPFYALCGLLVFYKKPYNFVEHMVVWSYVFAVVNILTFLSTPLIIAFSFNYFGFSTIFTVIYLILTAWYYKRIFKLSIGKSILKGILLTISLFVIQTIVFLLAAIIIISLIIWLNPESLEGINMTYFGKKL